MATFLGLLLLVTLVAKAAAATAMLCGLLGLSQHDLRARSQAGEAEARLLYPLVARAHELTVLLLFVRVCAVVGSVLILNWLIPGVGFWPGFVTWLLAIVALLAVVELWPLALWQPAALRLATRFAPHLTRVLDAIRPVTLVVGNWLERHVGNVRVPAFRSKAELLNLLKDYEASTDPEVAADTAAIVKSALEFGDKPIRESMTPKSVVVAVAEDQVISPAFLKELHDSGHSRFPVFRDSLDQVVGTLYLHELVDVKRDKLTAAQAMSKHVYYVNEDDKLDHALNAFLRTKHHLFIVVNSFHETTGVITIEDILEAAIGRRIVDEFDRYDDLRAVAARQGAKQQRATPAIADSESEQAETATEADSKESEDE